MAAASSRTIDEVIVEEIDLVDVEDVAVGVGQDARLKAAGAHPHGRFDVYGTDQAVFRGVDRQVDDPHWLLRHRQRPGFRPLAAFVTVASGRPGVASVGAPGDHRVVRQ